MHTGRNVSQQLHGIRWNVFTFTLFFTVSVHLPLVIRKVGMKNKNVLWYNMIFNVVKYMISRIR